MLANVLCAGFSAIAAVIVFIKLRQENGKRASWFLLLAFGFAWLAYDILTIGCGWPISVGIVMLATAMIGALTDIATGKKGE